MRTPTDVPTTRVRLRAVRAGVSRLDLATGLLSPRLLSHSGTVASVALLATHATLLGGDHVRVELSVDEGCRLEITDIAATIAYHGRGLTSRLEVAIDVAPGGVLTWRAEPLVVSEGADVRRTLDASIGDGGALLIRDTLVLGRSGESGGSLHCHTNAMYAGAPALVETLTLGADTPAGVSGLPGYLDASPLNSAAAPTRVIDSVLALGWRPSAASDSPGEIGCNTTIFGLDQPGSLARALLPAAHDSRLPALFDAWAQQLATSN